MAAFAQNVKFLKVVRAAFITKYVSLLDPILSL